VTREGLNVYRDLLADRTVNVKGKHIHTSRMVACCFRPCSRCGRRSISAIVGRQHRRCRWPDRQFERRLLRSSKDLELIPGKRCPKTWVKRRLVHSFDPLAIVLHRNESCPTSLEPARVRGEMLQVNGDIEKMVELLGAARSQMIAQLAASIAITRDDQLRKRLGAIAAVDPGQEFLISQLKDQAWLKVGGLGYTVDRKRQAGLPAINLDELLCTQSEFARSLQNSMQRTHAMRDACNILEPVFEPSPIQSRSNFDEIFKWAPLLEQVAYKSAMRVLHVLDMLRSVVRHELSGTSRRDAASLQAYWRLVHALGQLILIASSNEARPWLEDMANSFVIASYGRLGLQASCS
jgi:hypothetical protein